ncbi:arginine--tRNA ligase [candidate division KSB3 bacterium]|uniref:Arginine--tRNA ligase n=1 Tax=candidate division KSB3 bacterium TaxID=2044937 RepID=A0A2G6E621_9BACT|nr:MAG: arginine--tRNA ligase [candidate division KSB3 bacterium]PIE30068.1 MAG: arginine--tRNA ligase [candidate division KSB3 bacterium]
MEELIREVLGDALNRAKEAGELNYECVPDIVLRRPPDKAQGDLASTIALQLASQLRRKPREVAECLVKHLETGHSPVQKCEIAGPGFINFFLNQDFWADELLQILKARDQFGRIDIGQQQKVQVEFVSTNPTGPLHVGHGRGAIVGDMTARVLAYAGYNVQREYYVNDAGSQMDKLGQSTWCRYMELQGKDVPFAEDGYQGEYIYDIAKKMIEEKGAVYVSMPYEEALPTFKRYACQEILQGIRENLERFNVTFDEWFSEQQLHDANAIESVVERLQSEGVMYEDGGAMWFKSTDYGDEKDRVVIRSDGRPTYFASDIAYHDNKFARGFQKVINVWGADHHGYVPRMKGVVRALGYEEDALEVILVQMVSLLRDGERVAMSTRSGKFITLAEVVDEVGVDATRFMFNMRRCDSQLEFDLELAKRHSRENPVYYVQYAHARICSIFRGADEQGIMLPETSEIDFRLLTLDEERELIARLRHFPKVIEVSARYLEPHRITYYVHDVASVFHAYYNKHRVVDTEDLPLSHARLALVQGIQIVLQNALALLGVSAPEQM